LFQALKDREEWLKLGRAAMKRLDIDFAIRVIPILSDRFATGQFLNDTAYSSFWGATTFSTMTLSIATFSVIDLIATQHKNYQH
jgi:hypothetical protein